MSARIKGPIPPHFQYLEFLDAPEHEALLEWAIANRTRFKAAHLAGGVLDPTKRVSETLRDIGPMDPILRERLTRLLPDILARMGMKAFDLSSLELQLAAHGDGAHFTPHRDIPIGPDRKPVGGDDGGKHDRIVSAVYYFHGEPKRFSGGALRLHRFGSDGIEGDYVDIEPIGNSLLAFPSWATHEVRRVQCPSGEFADHRFALNCWFCKAID